VSGALISIAACIGFVVILVRIRPDFASIIQHPESQMAGFVLILDLLWLLVPLALVLLGVVGFGLGYVLHRVATRPAVEAPVKGEDLSHPTDMPEDPHKGTS